MYGFRFESSRFWLFLVWVQGHIVSDLQLKFSVL